jgi:hypothetical protein
MSLIDVVQLFHVTLELQANSSTSFKLHVWTRLEQDVIYEISR